MGFLCVTRRLGVSAVSVFPAFSPRRRRRAETRRDLSPTDSFSWGLRVLTPTQARLSERQ